MTAVQMATSSGDAGGEECEPGSFTSAVLLAGHLLELQLDAELQPYGLTTRQYRALQFIRRNPDCTRTDLAQALQITKQAAGGLSHRMVTSRMLERVDAPVGYPVSYYVTRLGQRMLHQAAFVVRDAERKIMQGRSLKPQVDVIGVVDDLIRRINGQMRAEASCAPISVAAFSRALGAGEGA